MNIFNKKSFVFILFFIVLGENCLFGKISYLSRIGFLDNCLETAPFDLYNAGSPGSVICGGINGTSVETLEAVVIFIKYTSSNSSTGIECRVQFADTKVQSGGSLIWLDAVTHSTSNGIVLLNKMIVRFDNSLSANINYFLPVASDKMRLICQAANLDVAVSPWTGIVVSGDTLSVAIRGVSYE